MSAFVVSAVSDSCELLVAVLAEVRLLAGVGAHVNEQVTFLCKDFPAIWDFALE